MGKRKKKNKGKKKGVTCPSVKIKTKLRKGDLTQIEMEDLCNRITITTKRINILS